MSFDSENEKNISRRKFIRNSATLVGGAFMSTLPLGTAARGSGAGNKKLKLAMVGCGGRGTGAAAQALRTEGPVELVAMADIFRDAIEESHKDVQWYDDIKKHVNVPEEHKFVGFDAYKKAIEVADVVILATPPAFRPQHFEEAVRAGKHVFVEKPLACDAPGHRRILEAGKLAEEKNLSVVVGLQNRYAIGYQNLIEKLNEGPIGRITSAKCNYLIGDLNVHPKKPGQSELEFQLRNWHYFNWLWGGAPAGLSIHYTDIVNWAKGSYPVRARGSGGRAVLNKPAHGEIYDHFYIEYEYADGTRLHSEIRHIDNCYYDRSVSFQGTKGTADLQNGIQNLDGKTLWRHRGMNDPDPYQAEHDKLFASIRNGNPINDLERGAMSSMVSVMGRMAAHSGKVVEWDEAFNSDLRLVPENVTFDTEPPILPDENGNYPVAKPGITKAI